MNNSFAAAHPELVCEWSEKNLPLMPDKITYGSNKIVWWKANCGHEWQTSVKSRSAGEKCPICSGARVVEGINDLATLKPELARQWSKKNKLKPTQVSLGSHKKVIWKCKHGHEWEASVKSRAVNGTGCPYCSHNKILAGFNDLASQYPEIAAEWSERNLPLTPDMVNEKSRKNVCWKCKVCGFEWKSLVQSRVKGTVCPVCADRAVLTGYNDLATTDTYLLQEWDYERNIEDDPTRLSRSSMRSVWWKCPIGHSWKAKINERAIEGKECRVCEKEYQSVFPQLVVSYYAAKKGLKVLLGLTDFIGLPLEIYMPEEGLAIETTVGTEEIELIKEHLCKQRSIRRRILPYKGNGNEAEYAEKIKKEFQSIHIFISSDTEKDVAFIRHRFFEWRKQIARKGDHTHG